MIHERRTAASTRYAHLARVREVREQVFQRTSGCSSVAGSIPARWPRAGVLQDAGASPAELGAELITRTRKAVGSKARVAPAIRGAEIAPLRGGGPAGGPEDRQLLVPPDAGERRGLSFKTAGPACFSRAEEGVVHSDTVYQWFVEHHFLPVEAVVECRLCWQLVRPADRVSHAEDHLDALDAEDVDREIDEEPVREQP